MAPNPNLIRATGSSRLRKWSMIPPVFLPLSPSSCELKSKKFKSLVVDVVWCYFRSLYSGAVLFLEQYVIPNWEWSLIHLRKCTMAFKWGYPVRMLSFASLLTSNVMMGLYCHRNIILQTVNIRWNRNYEPRKVILGYGDQTGLRESGNYRPVHLHLPWLQMKIWGNEEGQD
jgi:hypothetical protein